MNCRTNNAEQTSFVIFIATIGFGIGFITFKEEGAGSEARRRPLPALPSRRGFFLDLLTSRGGDCAIAGVLRLRVEGPWLAARRPPPSSSSEEDETTTTGGRFPVGIYGRAGVLTPGYWGPDRQGAGGRGGLGMGFGRGGKWGTLPKRTK
jgi:hypothetical protein